MTNGDGVVVADLLAVQQHFIALKRLLESGAHKGVAGPRVDEDLEMNPKEREVEDEREDD